jgi:hypothetical protein
LVAVGFALLFSALPAAAQTAQGRISGTLAGPDGSVIPAAEVIATNTGTGVATRVKTNEVGLYFISFLQPGSYSLTASAPGFKRYSRTGIVIETSQVLELNIALELGALAETVTVTAEAPLVDSSQSTVNQFIDSRAVTDMPLAGRRALELVRLSSDVIFVNYSGDAKPQFSVSGGRSYKSTYVLDGGNIQNIRFASLQVDIDPPVEVIKEFKVIQNGYPAEYGGSGSGVLISTTKSGTNQFHGSAFEFFRNDKLDAAGFFAPTQGTTKIKAPLRYNLFGATLGGPVIRNRTHFFAGYEGTRRRLGNTQILTLSTAEQNRGDFSQTLTTAGKVIPIYDPATNVTAAGRTTRTQFPGNIIPASRIDPVAKALMEYWPAPNRPPVNIAGGQNFAGNYVYAFNRDNVTTRLDHVFSDSNRFFFRFVYNNDPYYYGSNYPGGMGDPQSPIAPTRWESSYLFQDNINVTPTLITEIGFGWLNRTWYAPSAGLGAGIPQKVGLKNVSNDAFPEIRVAGVANLGAGLERTQRPIRQQQYTNNWTWLRGSHIVKFGGEFRRGGNQDLNRPIISGNFNFAVTGTAQPSVVNTGVGFASYLLGFVTGFSTRESEMLDRYSDYWATFIQDDWKLTRDLTLNIGLRWETDTPVMDRNNRTNSFDRYARNPVSGTPGVVKFAGLNGWASEPYYTDWNNWGPRFGFAYKLGGSEKTVLRGAYGIFFEGPSTSANAATLGFESSSAASSPDNGVTAAFYLKNGPTATVVKPPLDDSFGAVQAGKAANTNVTFYEQNRRTGYAQHFNLGVQHQLPANTVLEIRYTANLSRKLPIGNMNINQVPIENAAAGNAQVKRPYPQFLNVTVISPSIGANNYHSGSLRVEKRYSQGLSFLAGYTFSRAIGDSNNTNGGLGDDQNFQDIYNRRLDRGPDSLDIIHRMVFSSTYDLPWGKGRRWLTAGPASYVFGGWTLGSIVNMQSGGPFTVLTQANTTNVFSAGGQRANVLRDGNLPSDQRTIARWFDTEAFAAPAAYTFGNAGRGILRGDGRINFDISINKVVHVREGMTLTIRGDFFNLFNHPDFGLPNRTLGAPNFGSISDATSARSIQLGLRLAF